MTEKESISKLINYINKNYNEIEFIELLDFANKNDLIETLNKYNILFIKAFEDKFENEEESKEEWFDKLDKWEDKILEESENK